MVDTSAAVQNLQGHVSYEDLDALKRFGKHWLEEHYLLVFTENPSVLESRIEAITDSEGCKRDVQWLLTLYDNMFWRRLARMDLNVSQGWVHFTVIEFHYVRDVSLCHEMNLRRKTLLEDAMNSPVEHGVYSQPFFAFSSSSSSQRGAECDTFRHLCFSLDPPEHLYDCIYETLEAKQEASKIAECKMDLFSKLYPMLVQGRGGYSSNNNSTSLEQDTKPDQELDSSCSATRCSPVRVLSERQRSTRETLLNQIVKNVAHCYVTYKFRIRLSSGESPEILVVGDGNNKNSSSCEIDFTVKFCNNDSNKTLQDCS